MLQNGFASRNMDGLGFELAVLLLDHLQNLEFWNANLYKLNRKITNDGQ